MWRNVWAVIRREYLQRVRSKWFVVATVGGPLIMAGLFLAPVYFAERNGADDDRIAIVDATDVLFDRLAPELEVGGWDVRREPWSGDVIETLSRESEDGHLGGFLVLDERTLSTGEARFYSMSSPSPLRRITMRGAISRAALEYYLEESDADATAILEGGELRVDVLGEDRSDPEGGEFLVAYAGAFFLYMVILLYAVSVMRATLEEKTSRVVEIIISSMKPWHLMLGKIVGVGAVSLTQMAVWMGSAVLLFAAGLPAMLAARPELTVLEDAREAAPGFGLLVLFMGLFLGGFFMYSGLYAAVGAMCSTDEEAQQAQIPMITLLVVPILMVVPVIQDPASAMATGLSLFPLFTPILMWARVAAGGVPAWQVTLSFVLMLIAVFAIAWVAGRIYRVGILMTGKRPTLPELWRWVREA